MDRLVKSPLAFGLGCLAGLVLASALPAQEVFRLKWKESGVSETRTGYRPHALRLQGEAPAALKTAPAGLAGPQYGTLQIGPAKAPASITVIVEFKDGNPVRLRLDGNANGDLTDDPVQTWTEKRYKRPESDQESVTYYSDGMVRIPFASGPRNAHLIFYCMAGLAADGKAAPKLVSYYCDYGLEGPVKIDGKTYAALLDDAGCTGDFRLDGGIFSTPFLSLDIDGDGKTGRGESFVASRPFEVAGKWWAMTNLTSEGEFQIAASAKPVQPEKPPGPDLSPGRKAPKFTAKLAGGKEVKFPDDYKGKIVLVDFWATWCGPCLAELPNVLKAYEKYHPQGLEILGISLDQEGLEQKLLAFTKDKKMTWPQVYDGKFWQAEVAKLYGVKAIPHMLLVDGDTGLILANQDIRGEQLAPAIEKGLAGKKP
jgi:peroxiredoxin